MLSQLRAAVLMFLALTVVTGVVYPLLVTLAAQTLFSYQANGSLIERDGTTVGSALIGQTFDDPKYFWSRPSATTPSYNAAASSGSNLGPTNPAQFDAVRGRANVVRSSQPNSTMPIPIDFVTASGSGLDPHISPAAAEFQVERIAKARAISPATVRTLVAQYTQGRTLGVLGEPRVNVLELNLALDAAH